MHAFEDDGSKLASESVPNSVFDAFEVDEFFAVDASARCQVPCGKAVRAVVEGSLEEVVLPSGNWHQIALTYCPRYYEQMLKVDGLTV